MAGAMAIDLRAYFHRIGYVGERTPALDAASRQSFAGVQPPVVIFAAVMAALDKRAARSRV
jgi:hypothetical protein